MSVATAASWAAGWYSLGLSMFAGSQEVAGSTRHRRLCHGYEKPACNSSRHRDIISDHSLRFIASRSFRSSLFTQHSDESLLSTYCLERCRLTASWHRGCIYAQLRDERVEAEMEIGRCCALLRTTGRGRLSFPGQPANTRLWCAAHLRRRPLGVPGTAWNGGWHRRSAAMPLPGSLRPRLTNAVRRDRNVITVSCKHA